MLRLIFLLIALFPFSLFADEFDLKPIVLNSSYEHDKWDTEPKDQFFRFAAYSVSFDGPDDDNGDGISDLWGIPQWVSYEIKRLVADHPLKNRPSWKTDRNLYDAGIAPDDDTYAVSSVSQMREVKTDYRFVRGHLCPKDTAERISADAAYNTHTILNAVPQLQWENNGIWKKIEQLANSWADKYGRVWVITGPVFFGRTPSLWLGQDDEKKAAVPDALFKIIVKENNYEIYTLTFLIPNILPKEENDPSAFLTDFHRIEKLTGLTFFTYTNEDRLNQQLEGEILW